MRAPDVLRPALVLLAASHPLPTVAVTAFATAYGLAVGLRGEAALLAAAVVTGQLSIGWLNDWVDAPLDAAAERSDKPVARGAVPRRVVGAAAVAALVVSLVLSFALGRVPGLVHCLVIGGGWAYDLGLKRTAASGAAYVVAFGALPAVATTALPGAPWPPAGVVAGTALLGLAAHFANTVGDTEADLATGVRGLPQRVGPVASLRWTAVLVAVAAVALLTAVDRSGSPVRVAIAYGLLAAGALLAGVGLAGAARPAAGPGPASGGRAFRLTLVAVALVVAGVVLGGVDVDTPRA